VYERVERLPRALGEGITYKEAPESLRRGVYLRVCKEP